MFSTAQNEKFALNISSMPGLEHEFVNKDYFATVCHELRTPLNAIASLATLLANPNINPIKQKDCAIMLQDSSHMLTELLNNLLDSFQLDNGKLNLEHIAFDITKIIEEAKNIINVKAREKGLTLHIQICKDIPKFYVGDPLRIRQILLNLLSNAVKFTRQGIISILVVEENRPEGHSEVSITVADYGIGIPTEKLEKIFDKYTQADASTSREYGGTGLGLFISQELAKLMKGVITVKSWPGMGSHFTLTLPLQKADMLAAVA